jgi:Uma2 family endonuclease
MKTAALVPLEEYLDTTYNPDCDYVDGEVVERNVGEQDHSDIQSELVYFFRTRRRTWKTYAYVEQRVQVAARRYRIPDVCVVLGKPKADPIFHEPPFICIEVLSKKDSPRSTQERIDDYLKFGVRYVWVINPRSRRAWVHTAEGNHEAKDGILRTENPAFEVRLLELFAELDA